jgi:hypothetical protein
VISSFSYIFSFEGKGLEEKSVDDSDTLFYHVLLHRKHCGLEKSPCNKIVGNDSNLML